MAQEKDLFDLNTYTITVMHNILRRANESLVINCDTEHITSIGQLEAYIGYLASYAAFLHHHHNNEDDIYFPVLIKPVSIVTALRKITVTSKICWPPSTKRLLSPKTLKHLQLSTPRLSTLQLSRKTCCKSEPL
ncbi:hypothetical protein BCR33DRAFT_721388 [Rhizoclosmatium globosum]|uniref:Hemerythrin-like domain-containing protein n=1 Tax=Rhizoclosmatium globosum TaxID=329046 RepID=A0A1Y2BU70_9FUNG|nr:hypothetical protein BCR33DRAFT_721388 [Rhizoclosmatium globosum]|eukprot:ORY37665.1 hypothetical protein BCR33DRAFT_721388 [Rhizoclosmatium globosum]